eukprot:jgi/Tetstr1/460214/TSEL_005529.t1
MIDFACVSSTTPTWSNDPRWCIPGIAAAEAEHAKLAADRCGCTLNILEMSFGVSEPFELASPDDSISLEAGALRPRNQPARATSPPGAVPRLVARQPAEQPAGGPKADSAMQGGEGMAVVCGKPRQQPESDDTQSVVDPRSHAPKAASKTEHRGCGGLVRSFQQLRRGRQQAPAQDSARRRGALQRVAAQQRQMSSEQAGAYCSACGSATSVRQGGAPSHPPGDFDGRNLPRPASVSETPPPAAAAAADIHCAASQPPHAADAEADGGRSPNCSASPSPSFSPSPSLTPLGAGALLEMHAGAASDVRAMKTQVLADVAGRN